MQTTRPDNSICSLMHLATGRGAERRGLGPVLRLTIEGQRHSFRAAELVPAAALRLDHFSNIIKQRIASPAAERPEEAEIFDCLNLEPLAKPALADPVIIHPLVERHVYVYYALQAYKLTAGQDQRVLVINIDAHHDFGYSLFVNEALGSGSWAQHIENAQLGYYLHFPSSYADNKITSDLRPRIDTGQLGSCLWTSFQENVRISLPAVLPDINEVWLTIDFDFFSFQCSRSGDMIYHIKSEIVAEQLANLTGFLRSMNLPITQVLPCSSPAFLVPEGDKKEQYIRDIFRLITEAF